MRSGFVSFNEVVLSLADRLGRVNLRNQYLFIKRVIIDAEVEINPYSNLLIQKKMTYHVGNGNFDGKNIVRPKDFFKMDVVGSCKENLCQDQYLVNTDFIILCDGKKRDKITFVYYGLACDGSGNPFISYNHKEAVLAYLEYLFYKPKMNKGTGNANWALALKREWEDRCMESRGEDFMQEIMDNLDSIRQFSNYSVQDVIRVEHDESLKDNCCSNSCFNIEYDDNEYMNKKVFYWQFDNLTNVPQIDECSSDEFLSNKQNSDLGTFMNGNIINFLNIAKYGFCIDEIDSEDAIEIYDLTQSSLDNSLDKYYDGVNRRLIFVSKSLISHSSIYFKFKFNGK